MTTKYQVLNDQKDVGLTTMLCEMNVKLRRQKLRGIP